jgi:hypothetical protein
MDARPASLLIVLAIACRGSGGGCAPVDSAKDTFDAGAAGAFTRDASVSPVAVPHEERFGGKYLVIIGSSDSPGRNPPSLQIIAAHPELGAEVARLVSSHFKNLNPCLEVVIAKATATKPQAIAFWKKLKQAGADAYVKNAGPYVGRSAALDAYCANERRPPPPITCGRLQFVEIWDSRPFVELSGAALPHGAAELPLRMLSERVWTATIADEELGDVKIGDELSLYGAGTKAPLATCRIRRFLLMARGTPHFSYGKSEDGDEEEPEEPGCGSALPFAELKCQSLPDPEDGVNLFAVPARGKQPLLYEEEVVSDAAAKALDGQASAIAETSEAHRLALKEGTALAQGLNAELETSQKVRVFSSGKRRIAVVEIQLFTGEGGTLCSNDVRIDLRGLFTIEGDRLVRALSPLRRVRETELVGLIDLEGDGRVEVLVNEFPDRRSIETSEEASICGTSIPYCDCPC